MNSLAAFSVWFSLLRLIHRCESKPPLCKQGMFYEESVFAYFSCNLCVEQSHYTNCERCCGSTTVTPSMTLSKTTPKSSSEISLSPTSPEAADVVKNSSRKGEVLIKAGVYTAITIVSLALVVLLVIATKRRLKKRHSTLRFSSPLQETQPSETASPVVVGCPVGEARAVTETPAD